MRLQLALNVRDFFLKFHGFQALFTPARHV